MPDALPSITALLQEWSSGDPAALDKVLPLVYGELRHIANAYVLREGPQRRIQATELVHEAVLRLLGERRHHWMNRGHFYGVTAKIMRRVLVDLVRHEKALKRGATTVWVTLSESNASSVQDDFDFLAFDKVLASLESLDPRQVELVELRFFADLSIEDAAELLEISTATAKREWASARAFLLRELDGAGASR
jgi:RNA polymerase sigma-70 factor (ECF subfamily)